MVINWFLAPGTSIIRILSESFYDEFDHIVYSIWIPRVQLYVYYTGSLVQRKLLCHVI